MIVRPATVSDLPRLVELWHEKMTLLQQGDHRFRLAEDAAQQWLAAAAQHLEHPAFRIVAAEADDFIYGYSVGCIQAAPVGTLPTQWGVVTELAIDAHRPQGGVGRALIDALRAWLIANDITVLTVQVAGRYPVEQAFWRALGAKEWVDLLWLKL